MTYYIYALVDPRDDQPFYVGKGKNNRANMHFFPSMKDHNRYKDNIIAKIQSLGMKVDVVKVYENIESEEEAYEIEAHIIKELGRRNIDPNGILTNICIDNRPPRNVGEEAYQYDHAVRTFLHIDGEKFIGNRTEFRQRTGFHQTTVGDLIKRKIKSIKGWYLEGTDPSEVYDRKGARLSRRDARVFTFHNLNGQTFTGTQYDFCSTHNISKSSACSLISGKQKEAYGWYLNGTDPKILGVKYGEDHPSADLIEYEFVNIDGSVFNGTRLSFSNHSGISPKTVHAMLHGTLRVTDSGWHLRNIDPNQRNQTKRNSVFKFAKEDQTFIGSQKEFSVAHGLDVSSVSKLVLGKVKSCLGWKLVS